MKKTEYEMLGVMSGTSLDGIDLAWVHFSRKENQWTYKIRKATTIAYTAYWSKKLAQTEDLDDNSLRKIDEAYTRFLATTIHDFLEKENIQKLDAIASHGHTVLHQPDKKQTYQIGNLPVLAELLQQNVVCDFRIEDVNLGGQGAPLVPIGDRLLFPDYDQCLNLGGFANVSSEHANNRIAYDICPVNTVLNFYAKKIGKPFDAQGEIAKAGMINDALLGRLEKLPYYAKRPPKSLGIEWVNEKVLPLCERASLSPNSVLATFTAHIARRIAACVPQAIAQKILVTGGGAYNDFLLKGLRELRPASTWEVPLPMLVEFKEALVFSLLGVLRLEGEVNVLKSVTGARKDHSGGFIYRPKKV